MSASDTRYMSKEFLTEFINIYQNHSCLWQVQSKDYMNKNLKNRAYENLVEFCKKTVPNANREFVTKKIQNLRAAFRKEFKKVESSKRSGASSDDVYDPTLWYYDLLSFTLSSETVADSIDNICINSPDSEIVAELSENTAQNVLNHESVGPCTDGDSQESVSISVFSKPTTSAKRSTGKQKRKYDTDINSFMNVCTNALQSDKFDEYEAIGLNVAAKLRKMDPNQAFLAETIINKVLYKGIYKQITTDTTLTERPRQYNYVHKQVPVQYVQSPLSSNSSVDTVTEYYEQIGETLSSHP